MEKEINEDACFLDMPNGLSSSIKYNQSFVKAPNPGKYPCNYAAEKVPFNDEAMKISLGK
jgi:hypothetical protein